MKLTQTERYMLAGAGGLIAERLADHYTRKVISMPIWALTAVTLGIYFGTHAVGTGISHGIDRKHGARRYRETSDEMYQQFNLVRQVNDGVASSNDRTNLLTKAIITGQAIASILPRYERPSYFNDPSSLYMQ